MVTRECISIGILSGLRYCEVTCLWDLNGQINLRRWPYCSVQSITSNYVHRRRGLKFKVALGGSGVQRNRHTNFVFLRPLEVLHLVRKRYVVI